MRKNCSSDREKLLKFEAEGREFEKILRSLEQFVRTVKGQNNFWQQNAFLTCSWRCLRLDKLEILKSIWKKLLGLRNMQEKLENNLFSTFSRTGKTNNPHFEKILFFFQAN